MSGPDASDRRPHRRGFAEKSDEAHAPSGGRSNAQLAIDPRATESWRRQRSCCSWCCNGFGLEGRALSLPLCCERLYPTLPTALASYQAWRASPNNDARWCDHWSIGS